MRHDTARLLTIVGALALATAASAQGRGGGVGGGLGAGAGMGNSMGAGVMGAGVGGSMRGQVGSSMGHMDSSAQVGADTTGATQRDEARSKRKGPDMASDQGVAHANANAGLATDTSATTASLAGLNTGMTVKSKSGTTLGTVRKIERSPDGTVRNVLVTSATSPTHTLRVAPGTISISGGVVTTTQTTTH